MKYKGKLTLSDGTILTPSGRSVPRVSAEAHEAIKRADQVRAEIACKAQFVLMGGDNSPEALEARGYIPNRQYHKS